MELSTLCKIPIRFRAVLIGIHAILKPDASRALALMLSADGKHYTLYIQQAASSEVCIECEEVPVLAAAPHEMRARVEGRRFSQP
jgi:hypothetical protein